MVVLLRNAIGWKWVAKVTLVFQVIPLCLEKNCSKVIWFVLQLIKNHLIALSCSCMRKNV